MKIYNCGELRESNINTNVKIKGWVNKVRKIGQLNFIDLRDIKGMIQIIINIDLMRNIKINNEDVLEIEGLVKKRKNTNPSLSTGQIEIIASKIKILNKSINLPFNINNEHNVNDDLTLKYRYLKIRKPNIQKNLIFRHKLNLIIHNFLSEHNFINIETPILSRSTPEGARDFLVPSRMQKNKYYALPQSPQLYKQLLMIGGMDKYYQITKCFRDEDFRSDRQPEFTQLDIEVSFLKFDYIKNIIEKMFVNIMQTTKNININNNFPILTYNDAIKLYGTDKPDTRFDLKLINITKYIDNISNPYFKSWINNKDYNCQSIVVERLLTNSEIKELKIITDQYETNSVTVGKINEKNEFSGNLFKLLNNKKELLEFLNIKSNKNYTIITLLGNSKKNYFVMGAIRNKLAQILNLIDNNKFNFLWVVDWPLFEKNNNKYESLHHPFTSPQNTDDLFNKKPENIIADAYDIVLNGYEIGGGSVRIHEEHIQNQIFKILGLDENIIKSSFGWFLEAFKYGAPPHAGIALGIDRICMILLNTNNIKDVIAFPKNNQGLDLMSESPNFIK